MAEYEINLSSEQVKGLLTSDDGLKGLVANRTREPLLCMRLHSRSRSHWRADIAQHLNLAQID